MKKTKLIATIASVVLVIALIGFGVYAATSVSFGVTSKINYVVRDVFVDITYSKEIDGVLDGEETTLKSYEEDELTGIVTPLASIPDTQLSAGEFEEKDQTIAYIITVKNVANDPTPISLSLSATYVPDDSDNYDTDAIELTVTGDCTNLSFAYNAERTLTATLTLLSDINPSVGTLTISVVAVNNV